MVSLVLNKLKIKTTTIELFGITRLSVKVPQEANFWVHPSSTFVVSQSVS